MTDDRQRSSWAVKVYGTPVAQGSMRCVGGRGRHQLIDNKEKLLTPWRAIVRSAGVQLAHHYDLEPMTEPLGLEVTFTVGRPRTVSAAARPWPSKKAARTEDGGGDLDKLVRAVGDALSGVVYVDDSQLCCVTAAKVYPDSPHPDALVRPGAFIRIYRL